MTGERHHSDAPDDTSSAPGPASSHEAGVPADGPGDPARGGLADSDSESDSDVVTEAELVEQDIAAAEDTVRRERDEYLDMLRRVQADFENYKKRMVRQQTDLLERAAEGLVVRLLPVLDAFDLARTHLEGEGSPESKALLQAASLLSDTLAKEGLERLDDHGAPFDPTRHDAVEHQPADADADADSADDEDAAAAAAHKGPVVSEVLRPGYRYKGKVIRPAMVKVRG